MPEKSPMAVHHVCLICYREIPHAGAACPHCRARLSSTVGATPQMLVGLFVVRVLFFVGTGLLTGAFRRAREHRATEHHDVARGLTDSGEYGRGVEQYRKALTYRPDDLESRLGLAQALYLLERYSEAEAHLIELRAALPVPPAESSGRDDTQSHSLTDGSGTICATGGTGSPIYERMKHYPPE